MASGTLTTSQRVSFSVTVPSGAANTGNYQLTARLTQPGGYIGLEQTFYIDNVVITELSQIAALGFKPDVVAYSDYYPFGMQVPRRFADEANGYRYGFNGMEKDDEIKGEGNSLNYTFRMHDPRVGRFFAVDPLAPKYAHNSPYAFSENRVMDAIELEGLEKGALKIHDETAKIASLDWQKVYILVSTGASAILSPQLISDKAITSIFNSGKNTIYVNHLPGTLRSDGKPHKIKQSSQKKWLKGEAWKLEISYDIDVQSTIQKEVQINLSTLFSNHPRSRAMNITLKADLSISQVDARGIIYKDLALYGIIMDETGPGGKVLKFPSAAAGNVNAGIDAIYTNDELFGKSPIPFDSSLYGITTDGLIAHEMGHNFGLHHEAGDYSQDGLMSNQGAKIPPTTSNNLEIINDNLENIRNE